MLLEPEPLAVLRAGGNLQAGMAFECRDRFFTTKHRFPRRERKIVGEIAAFRLELRMLRKFHPQEQIARARAAVPRLPLPREADFLPFADTGGNADVVSLRLGITGAPEGNLPLGAVECLFKSHQDIGLDILPALGFLRKAHAATATAERIPSPAASAAKKLFEEIAEPRAAEMKILAPSTAAGRKSHAAASPAPAAGRRRIACAAALPIRAKRVVFIPLLLVAENLVSLVDLLEFLLGLLFVLGDIGVMHARELAECLANFIMRRRLRHS